jgi:uncharacterized protein (TIGR02147 family)
METNINIYDYLDYRQFLTDYVQCRKKEYPGFSIRSVAGKMGCNPGFFSRVLHGTRNLSAEHVLQLCEILKLNKREKKYFELLVNYTQAKKQIEKENYFEQMEAYRSMDITQISSRQYAVFSHWYYCVLRELLNFVPCRIGSDESIRMLCKLIEPPVGGMEVARALHLLENQGIIKKDPDNMYKPDESFITSGAAIPSVIVNRILMEFMDLARNAIDRVPREERSMSMLTFSTSEKTFGKIRQKIDEYRQLV